MPKGSQLSFNGGELTEFMDPRVDTAKYSKGCRTLENFVPLPYGAVLSRPGTKHGGKAKYDDRKARLIPFAFSTTTTFDIEVGHEYLRFWKDEAVIGVPLEVTTPYQEEDIYDLQLEQQNDVVYIVHADYRPRKLTRLANDNWTLSILDFTEDYNYPPLSDVNFDDSKSMTVTGVVGTVGEAVTIQSSQDYFTIEDVGSSLMVAHSREEVEIKLDVDAVAISDDIYVLGDWAFQTIGLAVYKVRLEESVDRVTWTTKRSYTVDGSQKNVLTTGSELTPKYFRINITEFTSNDSDDPPNVVIEVTDPVVDGLIRIDAITSGTVATGVVIEPLHSEDATTLWAGEFFSDRNGWPKAVCFHKDRLCLGSSDIWLSQPGNYENFRTRNDADSGFMVPVRRNGSPSIQWMESLRELRIGTNLAEAVVLAENTSEVFAYNNFTLRWDSNYGSKYIKAVPVNGTLFFLQPEGRTLRFQLITGIEDFYDANPLTSLADHILDDGVVQVDYQRQRYPTFHGVRKDGQIASMLYEASQNVQAWYRTVTNGAIESISVTPRPDEEDRVAYIVKRTVSGVVERHVEFQALDQYRVLQEERLSDMWFVDNGLRFTGENINEITGLDHLEGEMVAILADGASMPERVVVDGSIPLDYPVSSVTVGLPYDYTIIPMYLESQSIMGKSKNITGVIAKLWRSGRSLMRINDGDWSKLSIPSDSFNKAPLLQTGDSEKIHVGGDWSNNTTVEIRGRSPLPLNIQALTLEFEVSRH